jgi:hypothetical protein
MPSFRGTQLLWTSSRDSQREIRCPLGNSGVLENQGVRTILGKGMYLCLRQAKKNQSILSKILSHLVHAHLISGSHAVGCLQYSSYPAVGQGSQ